jgi:two-component system NarL family response regulator
VSDESEVEPNVRLVVIEDQVSYGDAFELALSLTTSMQVQGRAADATEGIELCLSLQPDLVVCDYRLPASQTGTQVASALRDQGYEGPLVLLTGFVAPQVEREAAALTNVHVLSKDHSITEIISSLESVLAGAGLAKEPTDVELAPGELEVLELLNQGHSPAEIAGLIFLSLHTIRSRIKSMHRKLNVSSQSEAIAAATRRGLLVPPS